MKKSADELLDLLESDAKIQEAMSEEDVVAEYEDAIDRNDGWGAGLVLADFLGNKKVKGWLEMGSKIHDSFGSLPPGLGDFREFLKKGLIKDLQKKFKDKNLLKRIR